MPSPMPRCSASRSCGAEPRRRSGRSYAPEFTSTPSSDASLGHRRRRRAPARRRAGPPTAIGRPYFRANSKSRSSCAGTPITAPVPYSPSTKLATQIGTGCAGERIDGVASGEEPFLLDLAGDPRGAVLPAKPRRLREKRRGIGGLLGEAVHQRMLGREQHERRAVDGVDAGREHVDRRRARRRRREADARAPSDRPIQFRCIVRTFSGHMPRCVDARRADRRRTR